MALSLVIAAWMALWLPSMRHLLPVPADLEDGKRVVLLAAEDEYDARQTLAEFARELERDLNLRCTLLASDSKTDLPGLEALDGADLLIIFVRRRTLPEEQIARIRAYVESGRPVIGLRTASHAFENWKEFDKEVLGGAYSGHHGKGRATSLSRAPGAARHPILRGLPRELPTSPSWLYRNTPLAPSAVPLLVGRVEGEAPEPVAWVNTPRPGQRVFYTSLGHREDFAQAWFRRMLRNAVAWALEGRSLR